MPTQQAYVADARLNYSPSSYFTHSYPYLLRSGDRWATLVPTAVSHWRKSWSYDSWRHKRKRLGM